MSDSVSRLYQAVLSCRHDDPSTSRTARLLRAGRSKMAKKLAEEAVEVVIDAMNGDREAVVKESADLIYNLVVLWVSSGIRPKTSGRKWIAASGCSALPRKCRRSCRKIFLAGKSSCWKAAAAASGADFSSPRRRSDA